MKSIESIMKSKLNERLQNGNQRTLQSFEGYVDFLSNDYLSLSTVQTPKDIKSKPGSSRLIAGTTPAFLELEKVCAQFFNGKAALHFNSGYSANLGLFSCIPQRGDIVIYDESSHASIIDGIRLSHADKIKFKHNQLDDLKAKLNKYKERTCFVVIEGLYSMDGDCPPLKEINQLCQAFGAHLIVDEAHSGGIFGQNGEGICEAAGITPFLRVFTFGKAFGSHGAIVVGSKITIDYLINFSRPFIYTTAIDGQTVARTLHLLKTVNFKEQQLRLQNVITQFNQLFSGFHFTSHSNSPIQILPFSNRSQLQAVEKHLHQNKIGVKAIYTPTVPKNKECLRISLHANHSVDELNLLKNCISSV